MATTTQPTTFVDLYTDLQNRVRVATGVSATENQAKRYINSALHDMHVGFGEKFPWCERHGVLTLRAPYTTGTVAVTQGSTTLTGTGTAWATTDGWSVANVRAGGRVVVGGGDEVYEISSVTSDTVAVLATAWVAATSTSSTYVYFEDEYALASDFLRPIDFQSFDDAAEIKLIGRTEFRRLFPRSNVTGTPTVATITTRAPSGSAAVRKRVRLWKPPATAALIPYSYVTANVAVSSAGVEATALSSDTDEPAVPLPYRHAIVLRALIWWYRDKKDDSRLTAVNADWVDLMGRIAGDQEQGAPRPRIVPRLGGVKSRARRPWGGSRGSRFVTGTSFDEMR